MTGEKCGARKDADAFALQCKQSVLHTAVPPCTSHHIPTYIFLSRKRMFKGISATVFEHESQ